MVRVGPCPEAAPPSQDLDQLAHCNTACMRDYNRCASTCPDYGCRRDCARTQLAQCNCKCASLIPSSAAARGPAAPAGRALDTLIPWMNTFKMMAADANLTAADSRAAPLGDAESEYEQIAGCYVRYFRAFSTCAARCGTGAAADEPCIFKCARPTFSGVCSCESSSPSGGDIDGFVTCANQCTSQFSSCMGPCSDAGCSERCARSVVACTCSCRSHLEKARRASTGSAQSVAVALAAQLIRGDDKNAAEIIKCLNEYLQEIAACIETGSQDEATIKCVLSSLSDMCDNCGAAATPTPNPTTSAPAAFTTPWPNPVPDIFSMCAAVCLKDIEYCVREVCSHGGAPNSDCDYQCEELLIVDVAKCQCGCKQYIEAYDPPFLMSSRHRAGALFGTLAARRVGSGTSEAQVCVFKAIDEYSLRCTSKCDTKACVKECVRERVDAFCECTDPDRLTTPPPSASPPPPTTAPVSAALSQAAPTPALMLALFVLFLCTHA